MIHRASIYHPKLFILLIACFIFCRCAEKQTNEPLPEIYRQSGSFIKTLPYYNPDSCVLLIKRDVPPQWQGAAYQNLFLDGPEDSPMELAYRHLETYEQHFPADSATAFAQLYRGVLLQYDNLLDSARTCVNDAYAISRRDGLPLLAFDAQLQLASIQVSEGKTAEPIRTYLAAYDAIKVMDSSQTDRKIMVMYKLASAYSIVNNQREALAWLQRCSSLVEDESAPALLSYKVDLLWRKALIYNRLELPDSAITVAQKGLDLQEKYQTNNSRSSLMLAMGIAYLAKGDCQKSLDQMLATMRLHQDTYIEKELARAYLCVGQLDSAEHYYQRVLDASPFGTTRSEVKTRLGEIHAKLGRYELAYHDLRESLDFREKNFNLQKVQEIGAAKAELELERTRHQLAEKEQQQRNDRLKSLLGALLLLMALGLSVALYFRQLGRRRILEQEYELLEQKEKLAKAEATLKKQALEHSQVQLQATQNELNHTARTLALKNRLVEELEMKLVQHQYSQAVEEQPPYAEKSNLRALKILTQSDWTIFKNRFRENFPGFLEKLQSSNPKLTSAETRLFLLIKLNFDNQEIADALGISPQSVLRSRHRLKSKLGLEKSENLEVFIENFLQ